MSKNTSPAAADLTPRDIFPILPEVGSEGELEFYLTGCEILDRKTTKRVHMQVIIVWAFYNFPDITNEELSDLIFQRFPGSVWDANPTLRANTDRRKYNQGAFRCMGGWHPRKEDQHYAKPLTPAKGDDDAEPSIDELAELVDDIDLDTIEINLDEE